MRLDHTNSLVAFANLVKDCEAIISPDATHSHNRMNNMGEGLEEYIKDLFCNTVRSADLDEKMQEHSRHFSWLGNANNIPGIMLRGGDAIEVKKIEQLKKTLQLNSSYPKNALFVDDTRISDGCRNCENWTKRDIIYAVGFVDGLKLKHLWFVYGNCYAAEREVYARVSNTISHGIRQIPDVDLVEDTNELARLNRVDPLGITDMRVRGMWLIQNPSKVFDYIPETREAFASMLMLTSKYNSFPAEDRRSLEALTGPNFSILDKQIKDPNNPARLLDAKLLTLGR